MAIYISNIIQYHKALDFAVPCGLDNSHAKISTGLIAHPHFLSFRKVGDPHILPIESMYGIYADIWGILMVNVTIYHIWHTWILWAISFQTFEWLNDLVDLAHPSRKHRRK